jgi:hypothetical protein
MSFEFPFSGDVAQAINPWTWILKAANLQTGFININEQSSADPATEQAIITHVASYGRQLGRILDVMKILMEQSLPYDHLPEQEKRAVDELKKMIERVDEEKYRRNPHRITPANVGQAIQAIRELNEEDRRTVVQRLLNEFADRRT